MNRKSQRGAVRLGRNSTENTNDVNQSTSPINFVINLHNPESASVSNNNNNNNNNTTSTHAGSLKSALQIKRPFTAPTLGRSFKRSSRENTSNKNNTNNTNINTNGEAQLVRCHSSEERTNLPFMGRVVSAPTLLEIAHDSEKKQNFPPPVIQCNPLLTHLMNGNFSFDAIHLKASSSLRELLPQEERAVFMTHHYQLPLRLYYKLVDDKRSFLGEHKMVPNVGVAPKHGRTIPNPKKGSVFNEDVFSPIFQVNTTTNTYASMLSALKTFSQQIDKCSDFTRVLVWTQMFSLVGCSLSSTKKFSPVVDFWLAEDSLNILAIELLYMSFTLAQFLHPNLLNNEIEGSTSNSVNTTSNNSAQAENNTWKSAQIANHRQDREMSPEPEEPPKHEKNPETSYMSVSSQVMLLNHWSSELDQKLDVSSRQNICKKICGESYHGYSFRELVVAWRPSPQKHSAQISALFESIRDLAVQDKKLREILCFPHTRIPVFSKSDRVEDSATPSPVENDDPMIIDPPSPAPGKNVMDIKYILS